jgi:hypothetical protein
MAISKYMFDEDDVVLTLDPQHYPNEDLPPSDQLDVEVEISLNALMGIFSPQPLN